MLPSFETNLEWDVIQEREEGKSEGERRLGAFRVCSVNLAKLIEEEEKNTPENNLKHVLQVRLTDLLTDKYPNLARVKLLIYCWVTERVE